MDRLGGKMSIYEMGKIGISGMEDYINRTNWAGKCLSQFWVESVEWVESQFWVESMEWVESLEWVESMEWADSENKHIQR